MIKKYNLIIVLFSLLIFPFSCENNSKDIDSNPLLFDLVVDSSFICDIEVNGEKRLFDKHLCTNGFMERVFEEDSLIFGFNMHFTDKMNDRIIIGISKTFPLDSLEDLFRDSILIMNYFPENLFKQIFNQEEYEYAKYSNSYIHEGELIEYMEYSSLISFGIERPQILDGATIEIEDLGTVSLSTKYLTENIDNDSTDSPYSNFYFKLTDIDFISDCSLIVKGTFEVELYNFYGVKYHILCKSFKGYIYNVIDLKCF